MEFSLMEFLSLIFVCIPFTIFAIFIMIKVGKAVIEDIKKDRDIKNKNIMLMSSIHDMLKHLTYNISENNDFLVEIINKNLDKE